jgi:hypothetical protein
MKPCYAIRDSLGLYWGGDHATMIYAYKKHRWTTTDLGEARKQVKKIRCNRFNLNFRTADYRRGIGLVRILRK